MMKKNILLILIIAMLGTVGCKDNKLAQKAIEQGRIALANKEYDKAASSFELALNENTKDLQIKEIYDILGKYKEARTYLDKKDIANAEKALSEMNTVYERYSIKEDVDELRVELENIKKTIEKEKVEEVKVQSNEIKQPVESGKIHRKAEYLERTYAIQRSVEEMYEGLYVTSDLIEAANESYSRWDDLLNEIWGVFKANLPKGEMDALTKVQIQWIKDKESTAKRNAKEFEGGTMEGLTYVENISQITESRCKEFIELYMD